MIRFTEIKDSILHVLFPHVCCGCGNDIINKESVLCMRCVEAMPETNFEIHANNPVEKKFWGRLTCKQATAQYYFTRESMIQRLMHQFKYKGNRELGIQLGKMMGERLKNSTRFAIDALIPLPLFPAKEKKRGYNQATVLCEGMAETLQVPVWKDVVIRSQHTDTQTKKGRIERWQNMEGKFELVNPDIINNKHIMLVDDVITTGATLEACGTELLKGKNITLSIGALCYAER
ncbi:MAG TPA: phosphoribosyltransferase family protein [Chitinophagaceae bacterium]|nr:phosphoribosyltransferase family protein [Chitinophagaceae bacterium]